MKLPKFRFIVCALIGCVATTIFLNRTTPDHDLPAIQMTARPIDLSAYLGPMANYGNAKTKKVAPLILLDETSHFEPLQKIIQGRILLDFHATWCGPCKQLGQILDEIVATEELGTSVMLKIDIDQHPELARKFNVETVPKLVLLENGKILHEQAGMANRETIISWLIDQDEDQLAQLPKQ